MVFKPENYAQSKQCILNLVSKHGLDVTNGKQFLPCYSNFQLYGVLVYTCESMDCLRW